MFQSVAVACHVKDLAVVDNRTDKKINSFNLYILAFKHISGVYIIRKQNPGTPFASPNFFSKKFFFNVYMKTKASRLFFPMPLDFLI